MVPRIRIDGLGDVAPETKWDLTELNSAANGEASLSSLVLRDLGAVPTDYITGRKVEVDTGPGTPNIWAGFVQKAARRFWFPVDEPERHQRQWALTLVDNNVLFTKRVVFKKADPANVWGPMYGARNDCASPSITVWDDDVIADLVANYLDLSADSIDTVTKVQRVANIYYGQPTYPYNGGEYWADAMAAIAQIPAAIWSLDPDWNLVYADVDVDTAPFHLSDQIEAGAKQYHDCTIWEDGSELVNDALGWGFGKGIDTPVFQRVRDSPSIAEHGLWQQGITNYSIWCQATIDRLAVSVIDGSPSSHRGHKDDILAVDLVTNDHGLRVGQGVRFINHEYGLDAVIPIRKSKLRFLTPSTPRYELRLSHAIDRWGFEDPQPPYSSPGSGGGGSGGSIIRRPKPSVPGGCDETLFCGITDTFSRAIGGGWGTSDSGLPWHTLSGTLLTDGSVGVMTNAQAYLEDFNLDRVNTDFTIDFQFKTLGNSQFQITTGPQVSGMSTGSWVFADGISNTFQCQRYDNSLGGGSGDFINDTVAFGYAADTWYRIRAQADLAGIRAKIWVVGDAEPASWTVSVVDTSSNDEVPYAVRLSGGGYPGSVNVWVDNLNIPNITRCTQGRFDNFNRTLVSDWGVGDFGEIWSESTFFGTDWGVSSYFGAYAEGSGHVDTQGLVETTHLDAPPWSGPFTMTSKFAVMDVSDTSYLSTFEWAVQDAEGSPTAQTGVNLFVNNASGHIQLFDAAGTTEITKTDWVDTTVGWYLVKWQYQAGSINRVKVWLEGTPEPDWQVTRAASSTPTSAWYLRVAILFPLTSYIRYIDFDYAGKIAALMAAFNRFDNFDRTVASGFGSDAAGDVWTTDLSDAIAFCDGSNAVFQLTPNGLGPLAAAEVKYHPTTFSSFDTRVQFTGPILATGQADKFLVDLMGIANFELSIQNSGTDVPNIWSGGVVFGYDTMPYSNGFGVAKRDWIAGQWYRVRVTNDGTTCKLFLWTEGDTVPASPILTYPTQPKNSAPYDVVNLSGTLGPEAPGADKSFFIDYIDFDYTGKPCWTDCVYVPKVFTSPTITESGDLGTRGHPDGKVFCNFGSGVSAGSYAVSSAESDRVGRSVQGIVLADVLSAGILNYAAGEITVVDSHGTAVTAGTRLAGYSGMSTLYGSGSGWSSPVATSDPTAGVGRLLALNIAANGSVTATCDGHTITRTGTALVDIASTKYTVRKSGSGYAPYVEMSGLLMLSCAGIPPAVGSPGSTPLTGRLCETITMFGASYTFTCPYVPGSLDVYSNGVYMREGIDYTDSDPGAGIITFDQNRQRTLDVCYTIA